MRYAHWSFKPPRRRVHRRSAVVVLVLVVGVAVAVRVIDDRSETPAPLHEGTSTRAVPESTRLFVQLLRHPGTEPLAVANLATGRIRVLRGLRTQGGDPLERLHVAGRRLVWWAGGTWSIDASLRGPRRRISEYAFRPSATPGRLWFINDDGRHIRERRLEAVEKTVEGRVTQRGRVGPPCGGAVVVATKQAMVCQGKTFNTLIAIDPRTGAALRRMPGPFPLGVHGNVVATCTPACRRVHIVDVVTGSRRAVAAPPSFRFVAGYDGAFSPDGALLAVPARARRPAVALIDVARGRAHLVAGSRLAPDYGKLTWSTSGELFFSAGEGKVMRYRPGSVRATLLPFNFGARILDIAAR